MMLVGLASGITRPTTRHTVRRSLAARGEIGTSVSFPACSLGQERLLIDETIWMAVWQEPGRLHRPVDT